MDALEVVFRIVAVGRILIDLGYLQRTARGWFLLAANGRWIVPDQGIRLVEELYGLPDLVHFDSGGLWGFSLFSAFRIDNDDTIAGMVEALAGVERRKQLLTHVKFLGQSLA